MFCLLLYVLDMFHILLSGDSLRDLWNVCRYVCMDVCTYICIYVGTHLCMYICMDVRTYICTYVRMCVYICMCVYIYMWTDGEKYKSSQTCSMRGKRSVKESILQSSLCMCMCVCGKVGSVHALVIWFWWLYTVNLFWCEV